MWPDGKYFKGWSKPQYERSISEEILKLLLEAMEAKLIMAKVDQFWNSETFEFEGEENEITLRIIAFSNKTDDPLFIEYLTANLRDSDKFDTSGRPKNWFAFEVDQLREEHEEIRRQNQQQSLKELPTSYFD